MLPAPSQSYLRCSPEGIKASQHLTSPIEREMEALKRDGYLVLSMPEEHVSSDRRGFLHYISNIPERKSGRPIKGDIGAGSFGALNFASAYHNPAAVSCDDHVSSAVSNVLTSLAKDLSREYIELIPDRLCYRTRAQPAESYHYDATNGAVEGDCFFGTIYNLNATLTQQFICVPGTHSDKADLKGGAFNLTNKEKKVEYKEKEVKVHIPPGHACIFFENIIHRVSGGVPPEPILRKFVSFRLSTSPTPWLGDKNSALMRTQSALHHKGGVIAPMYPRLYITNHVKKLQEFADELIPEMLEDYEFKSGKRKGTTVRIPKRVPPSLESFGKMYADNHERFKVRKVAQNGDN